ncbi:MAG: alkaline phosphatase family protein [Kofleriaceae bacterium]|nr:alkaline phosphatase family protein [Kofleriaceae bacterium]
MKRRDALKAMGTLAGAAGLSKLMGCSSDSADRPGITNLVILCMENRSYDHYLGARTLEGLGGDGLLATMSNPAQNGDSVPVFRESVAAFPDPPHSWAQCRTQYNQGQMDGFLSEYQRTRGSGVPPHVMGYFQREDLPFSWALADAYATSDRWFSSLLGPTWPNRMYLHSGQSGGLTENILPTNGGIDWPSIHHQLNQAGIDWGYYYQDLPFVPLFKDLDTTGRIHRVNNDFWKDAEEGTLPSVTWLEPNFDLNDDHPPHHQQLGQQFMASVYAALAQSPQWENCMLVITYDEHGGFFDHVPPPKASDERAAQGFDQLGVRVPAFVAGPYVKQNYVSSIVRDHCSVLSHISGLYELSPLTDRIAWAPDLSDFIDLDRLDAREPAAPVTMPEVFVSEKALIAACENKAPSQPELAALADAGFFPNGMDLRHLRRDDAYAIAAAAQKLGVGGIRD